jgi:hypothetical protein
MASQISKLVTGESFLVDLGAVRFKWTIKDFKEILNFGKTIRSPNFEIETTDPAIHHHPDPAIVGFTDPATKVRSFRLEMEIPKKALKMQCPVYLVNETGGEILTKVALESYSPKWEGYHTVGTYVVVSMEADASSGHDTSTNDRKKVLTATLPGGWSFFPDEMSVEVKVGTKSRFSEFFSF